VTFIVDRRNDRNRLHPQVYRLDITQSLLPSLDNAAINQFIEWGMLRNDEVYMDISSDGSLVRIEVCARGANNTWLRGIPVLSPAQRNSGSITRLCDDPPGMARCTYNAIEGPGGVGGPYPGPPGGAVSTSVFIDMYISQAWIAPLIGD
jgi:hypothetical protein